MYPIVNVFTKNMYGSWPIDHTFKFEKEGQLLSIMLTLDSEPTTDENIEAYIYTVDFVKFKILEKSADGLKTMVFLPYSPIYLTANDQIYFKYPNSEGKNFKLEIRALC